MTATATATRVAVPAPVCAHTDSLRNACQRKGWYRVTGVRGVRGCFCAAHAERWLKRPLTPEER